MSRTTMLAVFLIAASTASAEAKRFRLLPGTKSSPVIAPVSVPAAKTTPARTGSRPTVVIFGTGGGSAASAQDAEKQRQVIRGAAWTGGGEATAPAVRPVSMPNPDARQLPVLGLGGGDMRPAKGFESLN